MRSCDISNLRALDLLQVMEFMGLKPTQKYSGTLEYRLADGRKLAVTPRPTNARSGSLGMFHVWNGEAMTGKVGGAGAIDLWRAITGDDFKKALYSLAEAFEDNSAVLTPQRPQALPIMPPKPEQRRFSLPASEATGLPAVRHYLCGLRKLPASLIDPLIAGKLIYANIHRYKTPQTNTARSFTNAVFVMLDDESGQITGSMVRGCYDGLSPRKSTLPFQNGAENAAAFWIGEPLSTAKTVVLTESPIESLSWLAMHRDAELPHVRTYGGGRWMFCAQILDKISSITCAFNNDRDGNQFADKLESMCLAAGVSYTRDLPVGSKDWNDALKKS